LAVVAESSNMGEIVKTVTNEASLNPQMTQIGADKKTQPLTWVTEVPDSVINFTYLPFATAFDIQSASI
jgi:hypothetical protein